MVVTQFALLMRFCGLSNTEAVEFLSVRLDSVVAWSSGKKKPPAGALCELVQLAKFIMEAAQRWKQSLGANDVPEDSFPGAGAYRAYLSHCLVLAAIEDRSVVAGKLIPEEDSAHG